MRFSALRLTTPPAIEPLSLDDAKAQIRVDDDYSDSLITALISAVRRDVEAFLGRAMITQTWMMVLDEFPDGSGGGRLTNSFMSHNLHAYRKFREIEIPRPPLKAIRTRSSTSGAPMRSIPISTAPTTRRLCCTRSIRRTTRSISGASQGAWRRKPICSGRSPI